MQKTGLKQTLIASNFNAVKGFILHKLTITCTLHSWRATVKNKQKILVDHLSFPFSPLETRFSSILCEYVRVSKLDRVGD